jgi:hypothetical protein
MSVWRSLWAERTACCGALWASPGNWRLDVVRTLAEHGIGCGVLMSPVIGPRSCGATVRAIEHAP